MPEDLLPLPSLTCRRWRHYKGGEYEVMAIARHSETQEPLVVYRPLYHDTGWWVRPYTMFMESVQTPDGPVPRFAPLDPPVDSGT